MDGCIVSLSRRRNLAVNTPPEETRGVPGGGRLIPALERVIVLASTLLGNEVDRLARMCQRLGRRLDLVPAVQGHPDILDRAGRPLEQGPGLRRREAAILI